MRLEIRALAASTLLSIICLFQTSVAQTDCPNCNASAAPAAGCNSADGRGCKWMKPYTEQSQPDVFYNYYAPNNQGSAAGAFPAPYPTPAHVGHTYYTYQALMPNEFLYRHHRTYYQFYNNGMGLNRTKVHW